MHARRGLQRCSLLSRRGLHVVHTATTNASLADLEATLKAAKDVLLEYPAWTSAQRQAAKVAFGVNFRSVCQDVRL